MSRLVILPRYSSLGASSRVRMLQYVPYLKGSFEKLRVYSFFSDKDLKCRYESGNYQMISLLFAYLNRIWILMSLKKTDILWVEKELIPWAPFWLEFFFIRGKKVIFEYDDAVYHNYGNHRLWLVRLFYSSKIKRLMKACSGVICGNKFLEKYAQKAGAKKIWVIPTVVDLAQYPDEIHRKNKEFTFVWIGTPYTVKFIRNIMNPLNELTSKYDFKLRLIGVSERIKEASFEIEYCNWEESTEFKLISECHVGIMPLNHTEWEKGKCGYKLIQYMACGLPVIGEGIGANIDIIDEEFGFLAVGETEWLEAFERVLSQQKELEGMGFKARAKVEGYYSVSSCLKGLKLPLISL
jgi:glycosyltransferase involved in cell wall biosynthesis